MDFIGLLEAAQAAQVSAYAETLAGWREEHPDVLAEVRTALPPGTGMSGAVDTLDIVVPHDRRDPTEIELFGPIRTFDPALAVDWQGLALTVEALAWDDVELRCDAGPAPVAAARWFDTWFRPDRGPPIAGAELAGVVHSAAFHYDPTSPVGHIANVDLGSAPVGALTALLDLIAAAGATRCSLDTTHG